jgi:hypothetical protein
MEANSPKYIMEKLDNMAISNTVLTPFDLLSEESILHILQQLDAVALFRTAFVSRFFSAISQGRLFEFTRKINGPLIQSN